MHLGFVGTGTITEAIVAGLLGDGSNATPVTVSPRGAEFAASLAARFASVRIADDNQGVVDAADMLFLAVRPQIAEEVITQLRFKPDQLVVSLIAATEASRLRGWIDADVEVVRAVPLPFVSERRGVTVVFPPHPDVERLFGGLGTAVPCRTIEEFELLATASALMGTYFGIIEGAVEWLTSSGIPENEARTYLVSLFSSLGLTAQASPSRSLTELRHDFSTKGGLNEQMFREFDAHGGTSALESALSSVLERVRGGTTR